MTRELLPALSLDDLNVLAAWIGILLGLLVGVVYGLFFHRADWLGGYASWVGTGSQEYASLLATALLTALFFTFANLAGHTRFQAHLLFSFLASAVAGGIGGDSITIRDGYAIAGPNDGCGRMYVTTRTPFG